jgi:multicomponent Na+:H+ antiporter subunit D
VTALVPHFPVLIVLLPLTGALLSAFFRQGMAAWALATIVSTLLPWIAGTMLWNLVHGSPPLIYHLGGWAPPWGIEYRVDVLNAFVLTLVTVVGAVIMPYARRSVAREIPEHQQAWFYTMYLLCLTGLLGIAVTGDAFNTFVFLEISSLSTYVLIALGRDRRAVLSSFQYLIMGTIGATFYVIGIGLLYLVTGTLNIADLASRHSAAYAAYPQPVLTALAFVVVGVSLKLALFPLHVWLPGAYASAPSVATTFLAGTATKVALYVLVRQLFTVFGIGITFQALPMTAVLLALSVAGMVVASLSAVMQRDVKRLLAYSSVAQVGYITFGISLANEAGLTGGIVHLFNHALIKTTLFLAIGAVYYRIGSVRIEHLAGLGRLMPWTMATFVVGGLGIIGVPGTAGFISKWYLASGAIAAGLWPLAFVVVVTSLIAVAYVGRVVEAAYFRAPSTTASEATDPPWSMRLSMLAAAGATIYFGLDTRATAEVAGMAARMLLGGSQ